jgi:GDP-4-dehydro-6-deoxy-D-mannose reductase
MRVLVTGANGFVGAHLLTALLEAGHRVVATGSQGKSVLPKGLEFTSLDLTDRAQVDSIDFSGIEGVVHLAGLAAVGPSFDSPLKYLNVNGGIEVNLFEAAQAQGAQPRFVIVSSGSLYDPSADLPLSEISRVKCTSPYAVSKLLQEQLAFYYGARGFECVVARPFNHIGPGQNEGFLIPDLARQIVEAEESESTTIAVGNLSAKRDYTDVRDIVRAYVALLEKGKNGEIYNICSGRAVSGDDILAGLLKHAKSDTLKPVVDPAKVRPVDAPEIYGDSSKLHTDTGWEPRIPLDQTLEEVLVDWRGRIAQ